MLLVLQRLNKHNVFLTCLPTRDQSLRNANTYNLATRTHPPRPLCGYCYSYKQVQMRNLSTLLLQRRVL